MEGQTEAMRVCQNNILRWRGVLVRAALDMSKPGQMLAAMRRVESQVYEGKTKSAAVTAIRRMLKETRVKMGLPAGLPASPIKTTDPKKIRPGKPTDAQLREYRDKYCLPWLAANHGYPRPEQLSDLDWDLRPYPPSPETIPVADSATSTKLPTSTGRKLPKTPPSKPESRMPTDASVGNGIQETEDEKRVRQQTVYDSLKDKDGNYLTQDETEKNMSLESVTQRLKMRRMHT
jgi:hypothetical protein